ncbi:MULTISPECIES: DUF2017 domain-containing protein [unclassified Corynebacterium]|uniref:DUF2017 domain-containing protein n=1 Tax=unclassified Corynebacterium TaxID=2624378 RepID=UPI0035263A6B
MDAWKRRKGLLRGRARFTATFEPMEREVLGDLAATVAEALIRRAQSAPKDELAEMTGMPSGHKEAPQDPALRRLLPDFEREGDEEYEGDNSLLRSLHENDICRGKLENLQVISEALGPNGNVAVAVPETEVHAWIAGLNDIRLYVASGEVKGEAAEQEREALVEWLAYNQNSLLEALMG